MSKVTNNTAQMFKQMAELPAAVAKRAHEYFVAITPRRSGNARRNTKLIKNTIDANYSYASDLDDGKSKQAPQGMSEPTIKKLSGFVDQQQKKIK
jgi:hypothetical protein